MDGKLLAELEIEGVVDVELDPSRERGPGQLVLSVPGVRRDRLVRIEVGRVADVDEIEAEFAVALEPLRLELMLAWDSPLTEPPGLLRRLFQLELCAQPLDAINTSLVVEGVRGLVPFDQLGLTSRFVILQGRFPGHKRVLGSKLKEQS